MKTHSNEFDSSPAPHHSPYPRCIGSHTGKTAQSLSLARQKQEHSRINKEKVRNRGCSAETDGALACRNIFLCGSRATLEPVWRLRESSGDDPRSETAHRPHTPPLKCTAKSNFPPFLSSQNYHQS